MKQRPKCMQNRQIQNKVLVIEGVNLLLLLKGENKSLKIEIFS